MAHMLLIKTGKIPVRNKKPFTLKKTIERRDDYEKDNYNVSSGSLDVNSGMGILW